MIVIFLVSQHAPNMFCRANVRRAINTPNESAMIFSHKQSLIIAINKIIMPPKKKSKPGPEVLTEKEERALTLSTLLTSITTKIEVLRDAEGNVPYGTVKRLVAHHQIFLPWLTRDHVNKHLRK